VEELLKILKAAGVEITDELKSKIENALPSGEGKFNQEELDNKISDRLAREKAKHQNELEQKDEQITQLKDQVEDLVDPEKLEEYKETVKEIEDQAQQQTNSLTKQYELKLAAKDAGVDDKEYIEFLMEKRGMTDELTVDDEGNVVVTDGDGNVLTNEEGKKFGPDKLIEELKEDKPELFEDDSLSGREPNNGGETVPSTDKDNPFKKGQINLTRQGELIKEEPKKAKKLIKAAGGNPTEVRL